MAADAFDAVIVGSGAGGGAAAWALCHAGARVLVLERGPHYTAKDFIHDELAVCRRDYFVPKEPRMVSKSGGAFERSAEGWIACCVGGGTVHMSGYFFRMQAGDFRGWPISYQELEPWYRQVEREIGVSGEGQVLPPLLSHPAAEVVEQACKKLGLRAFPIPRAIVSGDYRGRQACSYCGFCGSYGCEVDAKSSTLATFLAFAQRTGKLTLRARCRALRVAGGEVVYLDPAGGEQRARGRAVVVACSAIETARLLLASGVANGSGLVGKGLMFAALSAGYGRFQRPSKAWPDGAERLPFIDRVLQDARGVILFQRPHPNPIFQAERLAWNRGGPPAFGAELRKRMREFFLETHTIEWESFSEFLPHDGCDVSLDPSLKDAAGQPVARLRMGLHASSLAISDQLAARAREVMAAAGAVKQGETGDERAYTVLQCGTARMGKDPRSSVVNAACESHEVKGLYVADASSFCSSGRAPFTLTIMANGLRVGAGIAQRLKRREL